MGIFRCEGPRTPPSTKQTKLFFFFSEFCSRPPGPGLPGPFPFLQTRRFPPPPPKGGFYWARPRPLIPEASLTPLFRPWAVLVSPTTILPHLSGGVCLEAMRARSGFISPIETTAWTWFVLTLTACKCHLRMVQVSRRAASIDWRCDASNVTGSPSRTCGCADAISCLDQCKET